MKKTLFFLLLLSAFTIATAQTPEPCGVYEGTDKVDGLTRRAYLEINVLDAQVPDFSQTFKKGETYKFQLLPSTFMKKPSRFFTGKKATGFIKYSSTIAFITNSEVLMLTDPQPTDGGYSLTWTSDMNGKKGKCVLHVDNDGTLWFTGLGTFNKQIGPDKLKLAKVDKPAAGKPYLAVNKRPEPDTEKPKGPETKPADELPVNIATDANGNIIVPKTNTGTLAGKWISPEGLFIKLNSTRKSYSYYGTVYYGLVTMNGPGYLNEGIVAVKKLSDTRYGLYTVTLDTDAGTHHYSEIRIGADGKTVTYHLCSHTEVCTQMGELVTNSAAYNMSPLQNQYYGMFSTGNEVTPVPLNFYFKQTYDNGYGDMEEGYGRLTWSYNQGMRIDHDFIYDAKILENGNVSIKYRCGRTDNKYSAVLVWNNTKKAWSVTQVRSLSEEEVNDCYMIDSTIRLSGEIK